MKIFFVRHGDIRDPANDDTPLTQFGLNQAQSCLLRLRGITIDRIYSSPLARCRQTALMLQEISRRPVKFCVGLSEIGYDGETTVAQMRDRVVEELRVIVAKGGANVIIVSHGAPIQEMTKHLGHPDGVCDRGQMIVMEL